MELINGFAPLINSLTLEAEEEMISIF